MWNHDGLGAQQRWHWRTLRTWGWRWSGQRRWTRYGFLWRRRFERAQHLGCVIRCVIQHLVALGCRRVRCVPFRLDISLRVDDGHIHTLARICGPAYADDQAPFSIVVPGRRRHPLPHDICETLEIVAFLGSVGRVELEPRGRDHGWVVGPC